MSSIWFLYQNDRVAGPFTTEQVQEKLLNSEYVTTDLVWGRGLLSWTSLRSWIHKAGQFRQAVQPTAVKSVVAPEPRKLAADEVTVVRTPDPSDVTQIVAANPMKEEVTAIKPYSPQPDEVTVVRPSAEPREESTRVEAPLASWHYALSGQNYGPFSRSALIRELGQVGRIGEILIWTRGMAEWAPLIEFHDLLSELGVNKRQYPRCDITGTATIKSENASLSAPLLTISDGGLGVALGEGFSAGQLVTVEIHSPAFRAGLECHAHVRYVADGITGLKFLELPSDVKESIAFFIRQNQTRFNIRAA